MRNEKKKMISKICKRDKSVFERRIRKGMHGAKNTNTNTMFPPTDKTARY